MEPYGTLAGIVLSVPFKPFPVKGEPGFAKSLDYHWVPLLAVELINPRGHTKSKRVEAVVDSGSAVCLFHSDIGRAIGLKIESGQEGPLAGVIAGQTRPVYYHKIKLGYIGNIIDAIVGFSDTLSVAGLLGRQSFFDHCIITFDPSAKPPAMTIDRLYRV